MSPALQLRPDLKTTTINGRKVMVAVLKGTKAVTAFAFLLDLISEPIGRLVGAGALAALKPKDGQASLLDLDLGALLQQLGPDVLGAALRAATSKLSDPKTIDFLKVLLGELYVDDRGKALDDFEAAEMLLLLKISVWAVQENYGSFFGDAQQLAALAAGAQAKA
jgi:hypothetical protein